MHGSATGAAGTLTHGDGGNVKSIAPSRDRTLFQLQGHETLTEGMLYHPASDAFAAAISAGRYVGPFRLESSLGTSGWLPGIGALTMSADGSALAYVEEQDAGFFVVGASRWGPFHWIAAGPRFDAEGKRLAWIEDEAGGGRALWVDGVQVEHADAGSWDPHEGPPLDLPFDVGLPDSNRPRQTVVIAPVCRAGQWQARIGDAWTSPVQWMSDPVPKGGELVGFLVRDGARVCWREYHAIVEMGERQVAGRRHCGWHVPDDRA